VGAGGVIRKSTNGSSFSAQNSGTTRDLNGVHFSSSSRGGAVGDGGTILRTTNGGSKWTEQASGTMENLKAIWWASNNLGFAAGDHGTLLRTTNGGSDWNAVTSGTDADLKALFFSSTTQGLAVGSGGTVIGTGDGGLTWTSLDPGTTNDLYGVSWTTNANSGVAIGAYSAISYSTDGTTYSFRPFGAKSFDIMLAYKYFTPDVSHTLLMDAIDTLGGPLRGYQAGKFLLLSPGKDTTVTPNPGLTQCGYGGAIPACSP
jgi:photosystem II stability/assembly factor-like uncharacterized protein